MDNNCPEKNKKTQDMENTLRQNDIWSREIKWQRTI